MLEDMLDKGLYSEDPEVNKKMYLIYKEKFISNAIRSDERDLRSVIYKSKKEVVPIASKVG